MDCCNLKITLFTTNKNTVCVNRALREVTISDGTGIIYGYNCNYEGGAYQIAVGGTIAAISTLYSLA